MADKNVIIKQKLENEIVDFYPKTKSNIVVNESKNVTGGTVTDVFNNALPLVNGNHTEVVQSTDGIKINFTGSLAPNVTVAGNSGNPVEVTGGLNAEKTAATYTVSHKEYDNIPDNGYTTGNASENTTTVINPGQTKDIKIPQIIVDKYGHVTTAATDSVKITIPSVTNMVTGTGLTDDRIVLGNADTNNSSKVKISPYGIITSSNTKNIDDTYIPTSQWIENRINQKITEGAQYLGIVNGWDYNTGRLTYQANESSPITYITPNSQGDWARAIKPFNIAYAVNGNSTGPNGPSELVHTGDIIIYHDTSAGDKYLWDVIHTEVDTDTWRPIQIKGIDIGSSTTLNLTAGDNVSLSNSSGTVTISATDTTYKLGQNPGALNTVTLTPSINSESVQVVTINNVANATEADHVKNALTIQLNGGATENESKFTYNGSAAKSININANTVGAAAYSHDHGYIKSDGSIDAFGVATIGNKDRIVFTDSNDGSKLKRSSIEFGTNTDANKTIALTKAGTWATFLQANQNITINSGTNKNGVAITGTPSGTAPTLGDSGITPGTYCALTVNSKGIAVAGSHVIKYYTSGTTNNTIQTDTMLAEGGFAFVEIA